MPTVAVPNFGEVEFPDDLPPEEIERAIRTDILKLDPVPALDPDDESTEIFRRETVAKNLSLAGRELKDKTDTFEQMREAVRSGQAEIDPNSLEEFMKATQFAGHRYRTALSEFEEVGKQNPTGFWTGLRNTAAKATGVFGDIGIKSAFDVYAKNARAARTWEQRAAENPDGEFDSPFEETSGPIEGLVADIFGTREKMKPADIAAEYNRFASGALGKLQEKIPGFLEKRAALESLPQSATMEQYNKTEGALDAMKFAALHPLEVPTNIGVQGLVSSVPGLVLGAAGSLAGPAGLAAGAGSGSFLVEDASKFADMLEEGGFDTPDKVMELVNNPERLNSMRETAARRGLAVGTFDALSGAIAGKLTAGVRGATRGARAASVAGRATGDVLAQGAFGGAGEFFGQLASGEAIDTKAIFEEILGELPTGGIETAVGFRGHMRDAAEASLRDIATRAEESGMPATAAAAADLATRAKTALTALAGETSATTDQAAPASVEGTGKEGAPEAGSQAEGQVPAVGEPIDFAEWETGGGLPSLSEREDGTPDPLPHTESEVTGVPIEYGNPQELALSEDIPQFKKGANARGVVEPLPGKFEETGTGPVQVWRRRNGRLEVISGRHRLDPAQRSNAPRIAMQVHDEAAGFDARAAARLDAELNIRDENGSVADYANYLRDSGLSETEANERGLLGRAKGKAGFAIARGASEDVFALHQSGGLTDAQAAEIAAAAPGNAGAQAVGIRAIKDHRSAEFAGNLVKAAAANAASRAQTAETTGDLFGFDDSAMRQMEHQAGVALQAQKDIREELRSAEGAAKNPAKAKKHGVDVADPEATRRKLETLKEELSRWQNWPMHPELVEQTREGFSGPTAKKPDVTETKPPETPAKPPQTGASTPLEPEPALRSGYQRLVQESGFSAVLISDLAKASGVPLDQLKDWIRQRSREGTAHPATGDWSLSSAEARAGAIEFGGEPHLRVTVTPGAFDPSHPSRQTKRQSVPPAAAPKPREPAPRITGIALASPSGDILTTGSLGQIHADIKADAIEKLLRLTPEADAFSLEHGFIDAKGNFLSREQAWTAAAANGQIEPGILTRKERKGSPSLESQDLVSGKPREKAKAPAKKQAAPKAVAVEAPQVIASAAKVPAANRLGGKVWIRDAWEQWRKDTGSPMSFETFAVELVNQLRQGNLVLTRSDFFTPEMVEARNASEIPSDVPREEFHFVLLPEDVAPGLPPVVSQAIPPAKPPIPKAKVEAPQSDIFAGTANDPFNLVSETAQEREARIARELKERNQREAAAAEIARAQAEKAQMRLFSRDESGAIPLSVLEDALPTVMQIASQLHTAGVTFWSWAGAMVRRIGAVVTPYLRPIWRSLTGQNILPQHRQRGAIGSSAGSSFRQAAEGQTSAPERKRAQVFGEAGVGHEYEVRKVAEVEDAIRSLVFDGTSDINATSVDAAWKLAHGWANPNTAFAIAAHVRTVGGNELAPGIAQGELMRFARRMAAAGDPSLEIFLHAYSNLFPMAGSPSESDYAGGAIGASSVGALLNGRRWMMSPSSRVISEVAKERDLLAGGEIGDSTVNEIRRLMLTLQISGEELLAALQAVQTEAGETFGDVLNRLIQTGQLVDRNPMITAIVQMARDAYAGLSDFEFRTMDREERDIRETLQPVFANIREYLEKKGAQGLERDWWQALSGPRTPEGPLWTADKALQGQLSAILRDTMRELGLISEAEAATLTDAEKVAMTLGKQELREGKIELVDKRISEEIESRLTAEIAAIEADDTLSDDEREGRIEAVTAHYEMLRDAWEEATANMRNQPASKPTLRRMLYAKLKGAKWNEIFANGQQAQTLETAVNAVMKDVRQASAAHTAGLDYAPLEKLLRQAAAEIVGRKAAKWAANEEAKRVRRAAREAGKPERQAQSILDAFAQRQSDTPTFTKAPPANKVRELVDTLVAAMNAGFFPSADAFAAAAQAQGVEESTARLLFSVAQRESRAAAIGRENRDMLRAAERGSLEPLIELILSTPLHQQLNPEWRHRAAREYFTRSGLSETAAEAAATAFSSTFTDRLTTAREKAAERAVRGSAKWQEKEAGTAGQKRQATSDLARIQRAVRAGATDPTSDFAAELAREKGWRGFTPEQNQRLAELDGIMEDDTQPEHERVRAGNEMLKIARRANVAPSVRRTLAASVAMNILSGLSSIAINVTSPTFFALRKFAVDSTIGGSPIVAFRGMAQRFRSWWGEVIYALENDSYTFGWHEHLDTSGTALEQWLEDGYAAVKAGNPAGVVKLFFGLPDIIRRIHQSLDQASVAQENDYAKTIFAMEAAKEVGLSNADARELLSLATMQQELAFEAALDVGASRTEARVYALEAYRNTLSYAVGEINPDRAAELDNASRREGFTIVGRRDADPRGREISEGTAVSRGIDVVVGSISRMEEMVARANMNRGERENTLAAVQLLKRMVFGFIRVPWRVSHFILGDMPLVGTWRAAFTKMQNARGGETPYRQTWGTKFQERARVRELLANTALVGVAVLLYRPSDEDDDRKGDFWLSITGNGPTNDDRGFKAAWQKRNKPWSIRGKLFGVPIEVNLGRGAEAFLYQFAPFMAWDDYQVRSNQNRGRRAPAELTAWAELAANYMSTLWQRVGVANQFGRTANVFDRNTYTAQNLVGWVSGFAKNFAPVQRLVESTVQLLEGQSDVSTVRGALNANIPYVGPLAAEPALNPLGDEIQDDVGSRLWKAGVPFMLRVADTPANQRVYGLILEKGQSPPAPLRRSVEKSVGTLTDPLWRAYMKTYGAKVKGSMLQQFPELVAMPPREFNDALNDIGRTARKETEAELFPSKE